jgi:hypothetical protein
LNPTGGIGLGKKEKKLTVYLAGGMEKEKSLGAGWRDLITPKLQSYDLEVLNPCEFEPLQLKGFRPDILPATIETEIGEIIKPSHWHDLKRARWDSKHYQRFRVLMQRVEDFDCNVVENTDYIIVHWTEGAARGAGTHGESTLARRLRKTVWLVVDPKIDMPGWIHGCHTKIFRNFDELFTYLDEFFGVNAEKEGNK